MKFSQALLRYDWVWSLRRRIKRVIRYDLAYSSQNQKVFCIGWLKTGTTSIGAALAHLGYNHLSYQQDLCHSTCIERILSEVQYYDSFDDLPWNRERVIKRLVKDFPNAKFIMTSRNLEEWFVSYEKYFEKDIENEAEFKNEFVQRNNRVRRLVEDSGCELLVMSIENDFNWDKLCSFLSRPKPDVPFPRINTIEHHQARIS